MLGRGDREGGVTAVTSQREPDGMKVATTPDMTAVLWEIERYYGSVRSDDGAERMRWEMKKTTEAIRKRSGLEFLWSVDNPSRAFHLFRNAHLLKSLGMYEEALEYAYTSGRASVRNWRGLFSMADRDRLREYGDPIPHAGPFTLYRGVAGRGRQRAVRHFSWTGTLDCARWFAGRAAYHGSRLPDPAVFEITVPESEVIFYTNGRREDEYVVWPNNIRPRRLEVVTQRLFETTQKEWKLAGEATA